MNPETVIQIQVVELLSLLAAQNNFIYFSVPNEEFFRSLNKSKNQSLSPKEAANIMTLKKMGLLPGVSDLCIVKEGGLFFGMEIKTKTGSLSESQKVFRKWCVDHNVPYAVVRNVDEALECLKVWGVVKDGSNSFS